MKKLIKNIILTTMITTLLVPSFAFASERKANDS